MKFKSSLFLSIAIASSAFAQTIAPGSADGINDSRQITGETSVGVLENNQAMIWQPGSPLREISTLTGTMSVIGEAINNSGNIAGRQGYTYEEPRAYAWTTSDGGASYTQTDLGAVAGATYSGARGINSDSWISGEATVGTFFQAGVWKTADNGATYTYQSIGATAGGTSSEGHAINNKREIAGGADIGGYKAGVWATPNNGSTYTFTNLHSLTTGATGDSLGLGINESSSVVGYAVIGETKAVLWKNDGLGTAAPNYSFVNLGSLAIGSTTSMANDINDAGKVVGAANIGGNKASLWDTIAGTWTDLNTVAGAAGLTNAGFTNLDAAHDINSHGDIVGVGTGTDGLAYGFLLTADGQLFKQGASIPVPEPTSSVLLGLAGMSFLVRRKRK